MVRKGCYAIQYKPEGKKKWRYHAVKYKPDVPVIFRSKKGAVNVMKKHIFKLIYQDNPVRIVRHVCKRKGV